MSTSPDPRLDELFVRYWDNVLTPAETDELAQLLATDPAARDWFQFLCVQAVASADLPAGEPVRDLPAVPRPDPVPRKQGWSRRRAIGLVGGGLAAGIGGVALGRWLWGAWAEERVQVIAVQGRVLVRTADGRTVPAEGRVPAGATVSTQGVSSLAVLAYPDGSKVSLLGDSAITLDHGGRELRLHQGTANANLRPRSDAGNRLTLITALVTLAGVSDSVITLGQGKRSTEVEVHQGTVSVAAANGSQLAVVRGGELLTVGANGAHRQEPTPPPRSDFAWNLAAALPEGWQVGRREETPAGFVVRPVAWQDPYYDHATMFQIRSDHQWTRGLFRLVEDSMIHVRYRARARSPKGQVCFCVRTTHSHSSDTGMLEYNGGFEATAPSATGGEWKWLPIRAGDMLANKHTPKFGAPWVGFMVIFNTFETDVGLEVAEFRVSSGNNPPI